MKSIVDTIGMPALLEATAEECVELAHACLKYARKLRNENPTPKDIKEILYNLNEELADLNILIEELWDAEVIDVQLVDYLRETKLNRMNKRLEQKTATLQNQMEYDKAIKEIVKAVDL